MDKLPEFPELQGIEKKWELIFCPTGRFMREFPYAYPLGKFSSRAAVILHVKEILRGESEDTITSKHGDVVRVDEIQGQLSIDNGELVEFLNLREYLPNNQP